MSDEGILNVEEAGTTTLRKIRVIIIEDFKKNKIFLSVMDKKKRKKTVPHA